MQTCKGRETQCCTYSSKNISEHAKPAFSAQFLHDSDRPNEGASINNIKQKKKERDGNKGKDDSYDEHTNTNNILLPSDQTTIQPHDSRGDEEEYLYRRCVAEAATAVTALRSGDGEAGGGGDALTTVESWWSEKEDRVRTFDPTRISLFFHPTRGSRYIVGCFFFILPALDRLTGAWFMVILTSLKNYSYCIQIKGKIILKLIFFILV